MLKSENGEKLTKVSLQRAEQLIMPLSSQWISLDNGL